MCFKIQFQLHKSNQTKPNKKIKKPKQNWNKKEDNKINRKKKKITIMNSKHNYITNNEFKNTMKS